MYFYGLILQTMKILMHDVSVKMVKEGHNQYLNAMGRIKGKRHRDEAAANTVILSVQQMEGDIKDNEVINVQYLDDAAEIHGTDSIELFEIEFELVGGSIERVRVKTQKRQWKHNSTCHTLYQYKQKK